MFAHTLEQRLDLAILDCDQQRDIALTQKAALAADARDAQALGGERIQQLPGILALNHGEYQFHEICLFSNTIYHSVVGSSIWI